MDNKREVSPSLGWYLFTCCLVLALAGISHKLGRIATALEKGPAVVEVAK